LVRVIFLKAIGIMKQGEYLANKAWFNW